MPSTLTFLHAADLHIGAPFRGVEEVSAEWSRRLTEAIPAAWNYVVETAITRRVDFVIVAGDVFDSVQASYRDYLIFFEGLHRLDAEHIPTYLCTGNHDPLSHWKDNFFALPSSTTMLAGDYPDFALFKKDGQPAALIAGRSYLNKVWSSKENIAEGLTRKQAEQTLGPEASRAPFSVGIVHTGLTIDKAKAPTDPQKLRAAGFDYWALGHIHKRWIDNEQDPRISFSGCIQGRDVKETGPRGVNLVTLTEGEPVQITFIPTAQVVWETIEVDISDCETVAELVAKIMREQFVQNGFDRCEMMITRINLVGTGSLHELLGSPGMLEEIRKSINDSYSEFFCHQLNDLTRAPYNEETLRSEGLFPSIFLYTSDALNEDISSHVDYLQREFFARGIPLASEISTKKVKRLSNEAVPLVLDLLVQGGEDE